MASPAVQLQQLDSLHVAVVRRQARQAELSRLVPECCGLVWNALRAQGVKGGRNIAIYWDEAIRLEAGVETAASFDEHGDVVRSATPAGPVASVTHFGPYGGLGAAHDAIRDWCRLHQHRLAGPSWENIRALAGRVERRSLQNQDGRLLPCGSGVRGARHPSSDDLEFQRAFEAGEITPAAFDHAAHVRLAYVYLCSDPVDESVRRMKASLLAFLAHLGVGEAKYHETLTRAWIMAVDHFMTQSSSCSSASAFMAAHPALLDSRIMLTHYSAATLFSPEARQSFVPPDIQPIPPD